MSVTRSRSSSSSATALERLLYRLGQSQYRARFVLKGAMLFALWGGMPQRPTRDIDLLGFGDSSLEGIGDVLRELCRMDVADDGIVFDAASVTAEPIKEAAEYPGVRLHVSATIGHATVVALQTSERPQFEFGRVTGI